MFATPERAEAACVVDTMGAPSPDTVICNPNQAGQVTVNSIDANGVSVMIAPGTAITSGTMGFDINTFVGSNLTFSMDPTSSIATTGTAIDVFALLNNGNDEVQNWTIGGSIQSTGNDGIVDFLTLGGTVNMTLTPDGTIDVADDAITVTSALGVGDITITNDALNTGIFAGGDAISLTKILGAGTMTVNNNGQVGSPGDAIGGNAITLLGVQANAVVNNNAAGSIYSAGNAVTINVGGTAAVSNEASITSTGGAGIGILSGSTTNVSNGIAGTIASVGDGVNVMQLTGDTTVTNDGSINSTGGSGVSVTNLTGNISITNSSMTSIHALNGGVTANAVLGSVSKDNEGGLIETTNGPAIGLFGLTGVTVTGATGTATSTNGPGIVGVAVLGDVTIDAGTTSAGAGSYLGNSGGVIGVTGVGNVNVTTHGTTAVIGGQYGVSAFTGLGNATITIGGDVDPPAIGGSSVTLVGNALVTVLPGVTVEATQTGLYSFSGLGNSTVAADPSSTVDSAVDGVISTALTVGNSTVDTGTVIATAGIGIQSFAGVGDSIVHAHGLTTAGGSGILSTAVVGDATITSDGKISAGGTYGASAFTGAGNATVNINADIDPPVIGGSSVTLIGDALVMVAPNVTVEATQTGLYSFSGLGNSTVNADPTSTIDSAVDGVISTALTIGNSIVDIGNVTGTAGTGIQSWATVGDSTVHAYGTTTAGGSGIVSTTIVGNSTVTSDGKISAGGTYGILSNVTGVGDSHVMVNASVDAPAIGVASSVIGVGNSTIDVLADVGAIVSGTSIGALSSVIGVGNSTVTSTGATVCSSGTCDGTIVGPGGDGIVSSVIGVGNSGVNSGDVTVDGSGIFSSIIGVGDSTVTVDGKVSAGGSLGVSSTILGDGLTTITVNTGSEVVANNGSAVSVVSTSLGLGTNNVSIYSDGLLHGDGTFFAPTVFSGNDGTFTLTNDENGVITTDGGQPSANIVEVLAGGDVTVNNTGFMTGDVLLTSITGSTTINNTYGSGGIWNTSGLNLVWSFGGDAELNNLEDGDGNNPIINTSGITLFSFLSPSGQSIVNNSGVINVNGLTSFGGPIFGLDAFNNNNGLLNMSNGFVDYTPLTVPVYNSGIGDVSVVAGDFNGGGSSELKLDVLMGGIAPHSSASDLLIVSGNVAMTTGITVVDFDPPGFGAYNPTGIPLVGVLSGNTNPGDFVLNGGPIDKGLFTYGLFLDGTSNPPDATFGLFPSAKAWVLASYPDSSALALPDFITIAQDIWRFSSDGWIDRSGDLRNYYSLAAGPKSPSSGQSTGIWGRVLGAGSSRDYDQTFMTLGGPVTVPGGYDQSLWGIQGGIDIAANETPDGSLIIGILGGYAWSHARFADPMDTATFSGPMVGAYATWLHGAGYLDALVKADFLDIDYSIGGDSGKTSATTVGARMEGGYRMWSSGNVFFEPFASLAYAQTDVGDKTIAGTWVDFHSGETLEAKLAARFGGSHIGSNAARLDTYLTLAFGNEFLGTNTATLFGPPDVDITNETAGVFGEVGAGLNYYDPANGVTGFASGILRVAEDYIGGGGKVGVRRNW